MTTKKFECPKEKYQTEDANQFINHLLSNHPSEAKGIFLDLLYEGKIKIEVT